MPTNLGNLTPPPGLQFFGGTQPEGPFGPDCNGKYWFQQFMLGDDGGAYVLGYTSLIGSGPSNVFGPLSDGRGTITYNPVDKKLYFIGANDNAGPGDTMVMYVINEADFTSCDADLCNRLQQLAIGADAVEGTVLLGNDCKFHRLTGTIGETGPAGAQGNSGANGPQGPRGEPGPIGAAGSIGPQGPGGPTGAQGNPGPRGLTGPACNCCDNCTSSMP